MKPKIQMIIPSPKNHPSLNFQNKKSWRSDKNNLDNQKLFIKRRLKFYLKKGPRVNLKQQWIKLKM